MISAHPSQSEGQNVIPSGPRNAADKNDKWLPIDISFDATSAHVRWLNFATFELSDPFFGQTVKRVKKQPNAGVERSTNLSELLTFAEQFPLSEPAGVIFHVSRCGSTLLANFLKSGMSCSVLSEAHPIGTLFQNTLFKTSSFDSSNWDSIRKLLLDSVTTLYSAAFHSKIVIKCHAASMLQISRVRAVWPEVPFLILVRDPIEVIVSNLERPSGWSKSLIRRSGEPNIFGFSPPELQAMTPVEYCARGLAAFLTSASEQMDEKCWLVDYKHLTPVKCTEVARLFGVGVGHLDDAAIERIASTYSKDPTNLRQFEDDHVKKQHDASVSVRGTVDQWTRSPYETLMRGGRHPLNIL